MNSAAQADNPERKIALYLQHPDETPELIGVLPYLIHPPSQIECNRAVDRRGRPPNPQQLP
jgi:hypothetical protein